MTTTTQKPLGRKALWREAQKRKRASVKVELAIGLMSHQVFVDFHKKPFALSLIYATAHLLPCRITALEYEDVKA